MKPVFPVPLIPTLSPLARGEGALLFAAALMLAAPSTHAQPSPRDALIARAKALELDTPYVPPPGTAMEHHASGYAKVMCSAVFIAGLDPDFAAENVGFFTGPYEE